METGKHKGANNPLADIWLIDGREATPEELLAEDMAYFGYTASDDLLYAPLRNLDEVEVARPRRSATCIACGKPIRKGDPVFHCELVNSSSSKCRPRLMCVECYFSI